ncbi:helix-turn-helix transcriptional regulator [Iodobacter sp. CM08]|uniref:helix-turn-helix domain-containing protein n=1 Tax=Iodobacter sp. CM08 TaxID=3085902 RepID=UPI002980B1C5|nr:helix-turn-helix transcriptional regulator [Iodobacter sp. CM08]MDW5418915.1 helix-turn-helix transcriptional regulator [Iodobacter sp. CM08]
MDPLSVTYDTSSIDVCGNQHVSTRFREERKRLGLSQETTAKAIGISLSSLSAYERNKVSPPASVLIPYAKLGADVQYIITGERSSARLPDAEQQLITSFRSAPAPVQAGIMAMLQVSLPSNEDVKPKVRQQFLGKVGQVVDGKVKIKTFKC